MTSFLVTAALGLLLSILGVINMTGNISSLHSYHRKRVTEENKKPFGRLVGMGTIIIGISLVIFGTLNFLSEQLQSPPLVIVGNVALIIGIVIGLAMNFYAMIKYNHGIF